MLVNFDSLEDCADSDCNGELCSGETYRCINNGCVLDANNDGINDNEEAISEPLYNLIYQIGYILDPIPPTPLPSEVDLSGFQHGDSKITQVARVARALREYRTKAEIYSDAGGLLFQYYATPFSEELRVLNAVLIQTLSADEVDYQAATKEIVVALKNYYNTLGPVT